MQLYPQQCTRLGISILPYRCRQILGRQWQEKKEKKGESNGSSRQQMDHNLLVFMKTGTVVRKDYLFQKKRKVLCEFFICSVPLCVPSFPPDVYKCSSRIVFQCFSVSCFLLTSVHTLQVHTLVLVVDGHFMLSGEAVNRITIACLQVKGRRGFLDKSTQQFDGMRTMLA